MKTFLSYLTMLCCMLPFCNAQTNSINYKALIKDSGGNVVASQTINIRFTVIADTGPTDVYQETHTGATTDANGIVIVTIGEGTPNLNLYADIDWGSDGHSLKVEIDLEQDASFVDMGITPFLAVPYALHANNVSGLEKITENGQTGWRLISRNPNNFGDIGSNAIDLSANGTASTSFGATGEHAFATGRKNTASGIRSTAMGESSIASGDYSTAMGGDSTASGDYSTAMGAGSIASETFSTAMGRGTIASGYGSTTMGHETTASGFYSTAMGEGSIARSFLEMAIGSFNTDYTPISTVLLEDEDRLFVIGNGVNIFSRSDALTILKNGTITAPSFDIGEITDAKALITKEYADANYNPTGLEALDEGNGIGYRIVGRNPNNYGDIGTNAIDLSYSDLASSTYGATGEFATAMGRYTTASGSYSTAIGNASTALGFYSTAMGSGTTASGLLSTAMGNDATAQGYVSTAMGNETIASGLLSTAMGDNTTASGYASTSMGLNTMARSYIETVMGSYNTDYTPNETSLWDATDRLFVIGNGASFGNESDALIVLKNGTITAPSFDTGEITDAKALITKEYADANYTDTGVAPTGLEQITENAQSGWRMIGANPANFGDIGTAAKDLSRSTQATDTNGATGEDSFASGLNTLAQGNYTFATNYRTQALGNRSASFGAETVAGSVASFAIGRWNVGGGTATSWVGTEAVFEIGIGTSDVSRANAFTVLKNGNATLAGTLTQNSDRRLKTEITSLDYGLAEILKLNPVHYYWKKDRDTQNHKSIGLIAQEVQPLLEELVHVSNDKDQTLSVDYISLVPVLVKALQEQQEIIESQEKNYENLLKRVEQLEAALNQ